MEGFWIGHLISWELVIKHRDFFNIAINIT